MDERTLQIQACMYQYSRAIYRSIKDLIDPYVDPGDPPPVPARGARGVRADDGAARQRPALLRQARPGALPGHPALLPDHRARRRSPGRYAKASRAAVAFIESQIEAGAFDGGVARCRATTRKGKPCQRTPLPDRDYCPSHQHLERSRSRPSRRT